MEKHCLMENLQNSKLFSQSFHLLFAVFNHLFASLNRFQSQFIFILSLFIGDSLLRHFACSLTNIFNVFFMTFLWCEFNNVISKLQKKVLLSFFKKPDILVVFAQFSFEVLQFLAILVVVSLEVV